MLAREKREEDRARMIAAAFVGWQMQADSKTTFNKYLRRFGLIDPEPPATKEQTEALKKEALKKADRIVRAFRRGKVRKKK